MANADVSGPKWYLGGTFKLVAEGASTLWLVVEGDEKVATHSILIHNHTAYATRRIAELQSYLTLSNKLT